MERDHGPSRATGEGQVIAFVEGLASLRGRRRTVARLAVGLVLAVGSVVGVVAAAAAFDGAFG